MTASPRASWLLVGLAALMLGACARGADEARLVRDVQDRLNRDVKSGIFEVVALRREGSGPLPPSERGGDRVVVYFNATLRLTSDYQFGGWNQLGAASVAYALGATEQGVFGLTPENRAGDLIRAYGSAIYERTDDGWVPGLAEPAAAAAAPNIDGSAPPSQSKQLIDRLAAMVELPPPGIPSQQDEIIAEELAAASENIERRVKRRDHTFTLATGPADGEYARFGASIVAAITEKAPAVKLRARASAGSVENAWLLSRGEADYAIIQRDVAAAAFTGQPPFDRGGPLPMLRAVSELFPEAVHIVVLRDSPIQDVGDLRGRRVAAGLASSGSRFDATAILAAHDLQLGDLQEALELELAEALKRLRRKQLDAVVVTGAPPIRPLQQFAVSPGVRLLPLQPKALEKIAHSRDGLEPILLPANTYPQQHEPVATAASMALLVTLAEAPATEVERVAGVIATMTRGAGGGTGDVAKTSGGARQFRGSAIPLHAGAERHVP